MATEMKSPQQQVFDAVYISSLNLGYATYDYLPANQVAYPFVFLGEQFDQDKATKSVIYGDVQQTIHVYHTHKKRRELTDIMNNIKASLRRLKNTDTYYVRVRNITAQTLPDNTTGEPLLHGIIEVEFQFH